MNMLVNNPDHPDYPVTKEFETIYNDYISALAAGWQSLNRKVSEARLDYWERINQAATGAGNGAETAMRSYVKDVRSIWKDTQAVFSDSYAKYVGAHQQTWANAEGKELAPETVAAISYSANLVAGYAGNASGTQALVSWGGISPWVITLMFDEDS